MLGDVGTTEKCPVALQQAAQDLLQVISSFDKVKPVCDWPQYAQLKLIFDQQCELREEFVGVRKNKMDPSVCQGCPLLENCEVRRNKRTDNPNGRIKYRGDAPLAAQRRRQQKSDEFRNRYRWRAGIEATKLLETRDRIKSTSRPFNGGGQNSNFTKAYRLEPDGCGRDAPVQKYSSKTGH